jgi:Lon protease-like protein
MSRSPFDPTIEQLPRALPIFPLSGALLLPGGRLPLNIFEPRYLAMIRDAMAGLRMIGMIQPANPKSDMRAPELYRTGCAGKITSFSETEDGRFLITLTGVCRFQIVEELATATLYRQAVASYARFRGDLESSAVEPDGKVPRARLLNALRAYLMLAKIPADWQAVERAPDDALVNSLAVVCPFEPSEKQALLEAATLQERARVMVALIEMALMQRGSGAESAPVQ